MLERCASDNVHNLPVLITSDMLEQGLVHSSVTREQLFQAIPLATLTLPDTVTDIPMLQCLHGVFRLHNAREMVESASNLCAVDFYSAGEPQLETESHA